MHVRMEVSAPPSAPNNILHHNHHESLTVKKSSPTLAMNSITSSITNQNHRNNYNHGNDEKKTSPRHRQREQQPISRSSSSTNSEIEKELAELELAGVKLDSTFSMENGKNHYSNDEDDDEKKISIDVVDRDVRVDDLTNTFNGSAGLTTSVASTGTSGSSANSVVVAAATAVYTTSLKKRISSSRTPTRKARRIRFLRNGDRFYAGITIPVSNERYRSFESLAEDLTRLFQENVKIPGAVRNIYTLTGKKISNLDDLEDGQNYVCSCNNESFKKVEYNTTGSNSFAGDSVNSTSGSGIGGALAKNKQNNRLKLHRPSSPLKNGGLNGSPILKSSERDMVVHPRIVTLIRNGTKPRKIMRLLLNKRNSPSFDHILTAITQVVKLDSGCVRKVFTVSGAPVLQLADFFGAEDEFFCYGTERVNPDDFKLESDELKVIRSFKKPLRNSSGSVSGPKPKMPVKSKNGHNVTYDYLEETLIDAGIQLQDLPQEIRERYTLNYKAGDGNFAVVLKVTDKQTNVGYALKIIDKSKCKGKEHYIDAEVRVMKKLHHPHIIDLILDVDRPDRMYLVLEYVGGGDLFDAITQVTRFSEDQSRVMIRHLASAMAYLHSMSIVHRDIKPENLLVKMDSKGNIFELKLADFGLACEVTEPLLAVCGTPTYVAPEILMETGYGLKIDVWAAGIILYILLCGFPPFVSPDNQQEPLFDAILSGVYEFPDPYWSDIGEGVRDLISNMLQSDPDVRFSSEDILDHFWTMGDEADYR